MISSSTFAHPASPSYFTAVKLIAWKWPVSILCRYAVEFCDRIWISKISQISSPTLVTILHRWHQFSDSFRSEFQDVLCVFHLHL